MLVEPSPFASKEEELETYLDPFEPPKPWFKEVWNNKLSYVNANTKERIFERPKGQELWLEKIDKLAKLTPREDLDGYEYREDDAERRRRVRAMAEFDRLMQEEIKRREEEPNDIEIIEDVLYDLVESVHMLDERRTELQKRRAKRAEKATWHPLCKGYRMKPLVPIENEEGELETAVTDADFTDMIISQTGHMLSLQTPPGFFEKHEAERDVLRAVELEREKMEEFERNRPLADKARIVLALARHDPKAAARRVAAGVKERALAIPRKLRSMDRRAVVQASQRLVMRGFMSLLSVSKNPREAFRFVNNKFKQIYAEMFPKEEADQEMEALLQELTGAKEILEEDTGPQETEGQRAKRLWLASQPKPVKHADTILVTMTFLVDPPPMYTMRPPKTWQDDLVEAEAILRHQHHQAKEDVTKRVYTMVPQVLEQINALLGSLGQDAIEVDEEHYAAEIARLEKEQKKRRPLKPWESRRFVSPPPRKPRKPWWGSGGEQQQQTKEESDLQEEKIRERAELEAKDAAEAERLQAELNALPEEDANAEKRAQLLADLEGLRKRAQERQELADAADAKEEAASAEAAAAPATEGATAALVAPPVPATAEPVAGVDYLADTTGPAVAAPSAVQDGTDLAPPSPARPGKSLNIPKLGPLPPMQIYVPTTDEVKTKLRAIPQDVADRLKRMPGEVKDKVRKIVKELQEPRIIKDVHDTTERKIFEAMLIKELAGAVFLPVENVKIEEIRRLQKNDPKILALQERNRERAEALAAKNREQHQTYLADRARRKSLMSTDEEHFLVEAVRDFVEEQAEQWGVDVEKTFGIKKTVYSTLPSRLKKNQMLAIENGSAVEPEAAAGSNKETLLLQDTERALNEMQPVTETAGDGQHDNFPAPPGSPEESMLRESLSQSQSHLKSQSLSHSQSLSASAQPSASAELGDGSLLLLPQDPSMQSSRSADSTRSVKVEELERGGENASVVSGQIGELGFGGSSVSSATIASLPRTCPPEVISEEEIARLMRQREDRLGLYDEEVVNLMEHMVAEVYSRVYLEQLVEQEEEAWRLMGIPESKQLTPAPEPPPYFALGLRNPDILRHDPNYWLSKSVRPATKAELRDRRLNRLAMSIKKEGLELRLQQLRHMRDVLIYDAVEYYDENIEPIVERVIKPFARRMQALVRARLREYGQFVNRLAVEAKQALMNKLQEGLLILAPPSGTVLAIEEAPVLPSVEEMRAQYAEMWRERAFRRCQELQDAEPTAPQFSPPPPPIQAPTEPSSTEGDAVSVVVITPAKPPRPGTDIVACLEFLTTETERRALEEQQLEQQRRRAEEDRDCMRRVMKAFAETTAANGPQPLLAEHEGPEEAPESAADWAEIVSCLDALTAEAARRSALGLSEEEKSAIEGEGDWRLQHFPAEVQVRAVLNDCVESVASRQERDEYEVLATGWLELSKQRAAIRAIFEEFRRMEEEKQAAIAAAQEKFDMAPGANSRLSAEEERALVEEEEKNLSAELRALREVQAKQKAEDELRAKFRRLRRQRRRAFDSDVVDLLNKMCIAVEIASEFGEQPIDLLPEIEDDYDLEPGKAETDSTPPTPREIVTPRPDEALGEANLIAEDGADAPTAASAAVPEQEEEEELPVMGCEVSFLVYITEKERAVEGLSDLEAEDVAIMLLRQFDEPASQLRSGYLGQRLLDVQYKLPFKKQLFKTWESFWVHVIHPVFFYRTSGKSMPAKEKDNGGRLESGLLMVNPTKEFSERSKDTFMLYQRKYLKQPKAKRAGAVESPEEAALAEEIRAKAAAKKAKQSSVVDLNVDEFAGDVKNLQIVRPNMSSLTSNEVERMRRIAGAFDEQYKKEMAKGLVDGCRLHTLQYQALKNRDTAWRIYTNCKAKLSQIRRQESAGEEDELHPLMKTTRVSPETFESWMEELRKEQTQNLRELCAKKAADRELRDQEMALRRRFIKQRYWIINDKMNRMIDSSEVGPALNKELSEFAETKQKAIRGELNDDEKAKLQVKINKMQMATIAEEKHTRTLFDVIKAWVRRKNRKLRQQRLKGMTVHRKRQDSALYTAMYLGLQGLDFSAVNALWEKAEKTDSVSDALDVIYEDTDSEKDSADEEEEEEEVEEEEEDAKSGDDSDGENQAGGKQEDAGDDAKSQQSGDGKPAPTKRQRKKRDNQDGTELPFIYHSELMSFIEVYSVQKMHTNAVAEHDKKELEEVKALVVQRKQSMAAMGQNSGVSERREILAMLEERRRSVVPAVLLHNPDSLSGAAPFIPASRRRVSVKDVLKEAPLRRLSLAHSGGVEETKSAFARIEEGGLTLTDAELELCGEIEWMRTIREDNDFYETLQRLPLQAAPKVARDELIQFATVLREIVPVLKRVEKRLQKEKEEALLAAGFRGKKDMAAAAGISNKEQKRLEREAALLERQKNMPLSPEQAARKMAEELEKALQAGMNEEGLRRLKRADEALKRQAGREKAWLMAHPHRFIKYPGMPAFCIACKEKEYELWLANFTKAEKDQVSIAGKISPAPSSFPIHRFIFQPRIYDFWSDFFSFGQFFFEIFEFFSCSKIRRKFARKFLHLI